MDNNQIPVTQFSEDIEAYTISLAMVLEDGFDIASDHIKHADDFWLVQNRVIWQAMQSLNDRGESIDNVTVAEELRVTGKLGDLPNGEIYISYIASQLPPKFDIEIYAALVARAAYRRRMERVGQLITRISRDPDKDAVTAAAEMTAAVDGLEFPGLKDDLMTLTDAIDKDFERIEAIINGEIVPSVGVPSGLSDLDKMLGGGFQAGDLIIIAGRPGWGKTTLMLNMAHSMAENGCCSAFFSLEMKPDQLGRRITSAITGIPSERIRRGDLNDTEYRHFVDTYSKVKAVGDRILVAFPDRQGKTQKRAKVNVSYLRNRCMKLKQAGMLDIIYLDYIQLMQTSQSKTERGRQLELESMTRELKELALELDVPLVAGAQMNRGIEGRGKDATPKLSDLRETGAIENDADLVMFIHPKNESTKDTLRMITIEKHRNGSTGSLVVNWNPERTLLRDHANEQTGKSEVVRRPNY